MLGLGVILVVYGNITAEAQSALRTNDGDDHCQEENMLFISIEEKLRVSAISVVNNRS